MASSDECINTIRCLAADIVQKANSGHPGMPIGMAPVAHILFTEFLRFNPKDPTWFNRDRFVLSNGHGCALLYSMLHLSGYEVSMEDLQAFRQLNSKTPGHPERGHTPGVEVTTGPLGQGVGNAVGLAVAAKHLAARFNTPEAEVVNPTIYAFCGDGCLQEGVALEAISLAGHLGLDNLVVVYDNNRITIDGPTPLSFTEDVVAKMRACGWYTTEVQDGNTDTEAIRKAFVECQGVKGQPKMISLKTVIGFGAPLQDTEKVHGNPLGVEGVKVLKEKYGRDPTKFFDVEDKVYAVYRQAGERGMAACQQWKEAFAAYVEKQEQGKDLARIVAGGLPEGWKSALPVWKVDEAAIASRKASETVLNAVAPVISNLIGGSADLTPSTLTALKCSKDFQKDSYDGRYLRFGIREHGMTAVGNGIAAFGEGAIIPYVATFFNFVGYAMGAVRMAAISNLGIIFVATHDGIGLGEDGPTHQPVEMGSCCRAIPNCLLMRPCDGNETSGAYAVAIERRRTPTIIALSRQNLPFLEGASIEGVARGAYSVLGEPAAADVVVLATGSEVSTAVNTAKAITAFKVAVVSFPCWELFEEQDLEYKKTILPDGKPIVSFEAWTTMGWERYSHFQIGLDRFGTSAPAKACFESLGFDEKALTAKLTAVNAAYADPAARAKLLSKLLPTPF